MFENATLQLQVVSFAGGRKEQQIVFPRESTRCGHGKRSATSCLFDNFAPHRFDWDIA